MLSWKNMPGTDANPILGCLREMWIYTASIHWCFKDCSLSLEESEKVCFGVVVKVDDRNCVFLESLMARTNNYHGKCE